MQWSLILFISACCAACSICYGSTQTEVSLPENVNSVGARISMTGAGTAFITVLESSSGERVNPSFHRLDDSTNEAKLVARLSWNNKGIGPLHHDEEGRPIVVTYDDNNKVDLKFCDTCIESVQWDHKNWRTIRNIFHRSLGDAAALENIYFLPTSTKDNLYDYLIPKVIGYEENISQEKASVILNKKKEAFIEINNLKMDSEKDRFEMYNWQKLLTLQLIFANNIVPIIIQKRNIPNFFWVIQ